MHTSRSVLLTVPRLIAIDDLPDAETRASRQTIPHAAKSEARYKRNYSQSSSMLAMIFTGPPHSEQVSALIRKTHRCRMLSPLIREKWLDNDYLSSLIASDRFCEV
mgnify:CR=1 FL=1